MTELCDESQKLKASGKFTNEGLVQEIRAYAESKTIPILQRAKTDIEFTRGEVRRRKAALSTKEPNPADIAGALLRAEMRTWLRTRKPHEVLATLMADKVDERLLVAAMEVPGEMAGLEPDMRQRIEDHLLRQRHSDELGILEGLEGAAEVLEAALGTATYQLRQEAGFDKTSNTVFEQWIGSASSVSKAVL